MDGREIALFAAQTADDSAKTTSDTLFLVREIRDAAIKNAEANERNSLKTPGRPC